LRTRPLAACLGLIMAAGGGTFPTAQATPLVATIPVTNCNDAGPGSLREAMQNAAAGDTIDLTALDCSVISLTTGALSIDVNNVTIEGPGADELTIRGGYSAGHRNSVIRHHGSGLLSISNITFTDARNEGDTGAAVKGGCIYSSGNLYLAHAVVTGCAAVGNSLAALGGGIYAFGTLQIKYSTISDNIAISSAEASAGGGTFSRGVTTVQSTIDGNSATAIAPHFGSGGGIFSATGSVMIGTSTISNNVASKEAGLAAHDSVTMSIANSTISGNAASYGCGGVYASSATVSIASSTIAFNAALYNGGLQLENAHADLQSAILAENFANGQPSDIEAYHASTLDGADNIIRASHAALPPDTISADPMLLPLANNGGPTRTHALMFESPAIDAGNNAASATSDQRGQPYARVVGAGPDIGAFERQSALDGDFIFASGFDPG
jgi:hypothetical protein